MWGDKKSSEDGGYLRFSLCPSRPVGVVRNTRVRWTRTRSEGLREAAQREDGFLRCVQSKMLSSHAWMQAECNFCSPLPAREAWVQSNITFTIEKHGITKSPLIRILPIQSEANVETKNSWTHSPTFVFADTKEFAYSSGKWSQLSTFLLTRGTPELFLGF